MIQERIIQIMTNYGLNAGQFAEKLGVQPSNISHILSGRNKPSLDFITKLLNAFPDIDFKWLVQGYGSMLSANKFSSNNDTSSPEHNKAYLPKENKVNAAEDKIDKNVNIHQADLFCFSAEEVESPSNIVTNQEKTRSIVGENGRSDQLQQQDLNDTESKTTKQTTNGALEKTSERVVEKNISISQQNVKEKSQDEVKKYNSLTNNQQIKEKKIKKIIVLFSDGTYQELKDVGF